MATTYTQEQLQDIIARHQLWLQGKPNGEQADLTQADLTRANLTRANLTQANLTRANLTQADLTRANLTRANLTRANLTRANLTPIKEDFLAILRAAPNEAAGLRLALIEGRVDGTAYEGECACLVGTIANLQHVKYMDIPGISPDYNRPAERLFLGISKGSTPATNPIAAVAVEWIDEFLTATA